MIAVDGPSGSGKSSVSRGVADERGLRYLDTGAMYRAVAWWMIRNEVDLDDAAAIAAAVSDVSLHLSTDPLEPLISVNGIDASQAIRGADVTAAVSRVSAVPEVRSKLVMLQRAEVASARDYGAGIVVEGRDIGTVVLPDADLKIFLTADVEARAARRAEQDAAEGRGGENVAGVARSLASRDAADTGRVASPLTKADDAVAVDATYLTLAQVIAEVLDLVERIGSGERA